MTSKNCTDGRRFNGNEGHSTKRKFGNYRQIGCNKKQLFKLAEFGLSDLEICALLNISLSKLNTYRDLIQKGRASLAKSIRKAQLDVALEKHDSKMLIWVGKQYANQSDRVTSDVSVTGPAQVVVFSDSAKPYSS